MYVVLLLLASCARSEVKDAAWEALDSDTDEVAAELKQRSDGLGSDKPVKAVAALKCVLALSLS